MSYSIMDFKFLNDLEIEIEIKEDDELEKMEQEEVLLEKEQDLINTFATISSQQEIIRNLKTIQSNIKRFGATKELIHLINQDNNFSLNTGICLPYYESDEVEIEVPDTAEVEVIVEGISDRIHSIKEKLKESLLSMKNSVANFFKAYFTMVGIGQRKLDKLQKEKFSSNIDEEAFVQSKVKTYSLSDLKLLIKSVTDDSKNPLPQINGREYVWKHFPKILPLLGYKVDIFYKDATYLGEKIEGLQEIHISMKKDESSKIKKEKKTLGENDWTWVNAKSMFNTVRAFLDIIKHTKTQCDKVMKNGYEFLDSISEDYMYRQTQGSIYTKKAEIIYNNAYEYIWYFMDVKSKVVKSCMDVLNVYYAILKKAKVV